MPSNKCSFGDALKHPLVKSHFCCILYFIHLTKRVQLKLDCVYTEHVCSMSLYQATMYIHFKLSFLEYEKAFLEFNAEFCKQHLHVVHSEFTTPFHPWKLGIFN